jgi:sensor histidine kinase YesM
MNWEKLLARSSTLLSHSALWLGGWLLMNNIRGFNLGGFKASEGTLFYPSLVWTILSASQFYFAALLLYPWLRTDKLRLWQSVVLFALYFVAISFVEAFVNDRMYRYYYPNRYHGWYWPSFFTTIFSNLWVFTLAYGYRNRLDLRLARQREQALQQENTATELALLRQQVNPHFLFNTLNNLFGMARKANDTATADGIARLSGLMRYMLYESNADTVALEREWEFLRNYIALQKMRYGPADPIDIRFDLTGDASGMRIPPMLLITPVENAFKHGVRLDKPSHVHVTGHIQADAAAPVFRFMVANSYFAHNGVTVRDAEGGIGLANLRKRLALLYPGTPVLQQTQTGNTFTLTLTLPISQPTHAKPA